MDWYRKRRAILASAATLAALLPLSAPPAAAAPPAPASKPAAAEPTSDQLLAAIDDLGSPDPAARERASRRLWSAGPAAEPLLRAAANGQGVDPETAARARRVLEDFASGLDPDTPDEVIRVARAYRDDAPARKPAHANELALAGVPGWRVLTRLWGRELAAASPQQRQAIFGPLTGSMVDAARLLVAPQAGGGRDGDDDRAEILLEIAAALGRPGDADDYVTFVVQRGRLAEVIARWTSAAPAATAPAARVIALLRRASGDLAAARAAAADVRDDDLARRFAWEAGDWKAAAGPMEPVSPDVAVPRLAEIAVFRHRTGDAAGADEARRAVRASKDAAREFTAAADAFFYTGRFDDGVALLVELGRPVEAFRLHAARLRFADAFALADRVREQAADDEQAALVQVDAARQLYELGERDAARARLDQAAGVNETARRYLVAVAIAEAEQQFDGARGRGDGGRPPRVAMGGRAERVAVAALERGDPAADEAPPGTMLNALWPADDDDRAPIDSAGWWEFLRRPRDAGMPTPPVQQSFDTLRGLVERTASRAEVDALLKDVEADATRNPDPDVRAARLRLLGGTLRALGRHDEAIPHLAAAANRGRGAYAFMTLGDYLADLGRWSDAAEWFGRAYEAGGGGSGEATLMWLRGWALSRTGGASDAEEGRALMATALKLPMGDQDARISLMTTLARHGHQPLATEQFRLINAVPLPAGGTAVWELQRGAWDAIERRQWARAALLFERSACPGWNVPFFRDDAGRLAMPAAIHRLRARGLVAAGDVPAGMREADEALRALPGDVTVAIDVCEDLDAAGHKPDADALYAKVAAARRAACDAYPGSAGHHNELAWMQAKCGRDLPEALAHARRAVELEPDSAAYLDTLAEALFRGGRAAEAIERMKRCVELDPKSKYFKAQLRRFEGKPADPEEAGDR